jgi:hypothetical protein
MTAGHAPARIYWHRELPPIGAVACGEGTLEASSPHVRNSLEMRDHLWDASLAALKREAVHRLEQEMARHKAAYAHVLTEAVETRRNDATGEAWLHGRFGYVLLREGPAREDASA